MNWLLYCAALLPPVAAGFGISAWLRPRREVDALEVFGLSVLLGALFCSVLVLAAGYVFSGASVGIAVWTVSITLGLAGLWTWRRHGIRPAPAGLVIAMALCGVLVAWQAMLLPMGCDGLLNFEFRAHLAILNGGRIPHEFFTDASRAGMHLNYPLFLPMSELAFYSCSFEPNQTAVKMLGGLWFAAVAALGASGLRRVTGENWRGWILLGLLLVTPAVVMAPGGAGWLWGDFPLGCFALGAALYLLEYRASGTGVRAFAVMTMALPWIKQEGIVLAGVLLTAFFIVAARKRAWRDAVQGVLPTLLMVAAWRGFLAWMHPAVSSDYAPVSLGIVMERFERVGSIATFLLRELAVWQRWSLLWLLAALAAWRTARTPALARWVPLVPVIIAIVAIETGAYLLSNWDFRWHMITSLPRLLLPPAMLAIPLIVAAIPSPRSEPEQPK